MATIIYPNGNQVNVIKEEGRFTLEDQQAIVEGYIEYGFIDNESDTVMVVNDEGALRQLKPNQVASDLYWQHWHAHKSRAIFGTVLVGSTKEILGDDEEE